MYLVGHLHNIICFQELEEKLSRVEEDSVVNKTMRSHISMLPELERENKKLKDEMLYLRYCVICKVKTS